MKRRWKLLGAVCVFVVGVTFLRIPWKAEQKSRVERQAEAPSGWRDVSRFDDVVCFDYGGWGFGSSTRYWGVNYVTDNRLVGFQGMSMEGAAPDGEGWLWEENPGDNRCYVEPLAPCWYYFEMKF